MTKIEWTDETWNPVVGCTKVSPGCSRCYAETMGARLKAMALADVEAGRDPGRKRHYIEAIDERGHWSGKLVPVPEALEDPLQWKKPRMVFVNSMSDLFHKDVPVEFIARCFEVMQKCPHHTFQVLTKRAERMAEVTDTLFRHWFVRFPNGEPPNVWLGTSVERQEEADERIPQLLKCPAAVRFLSCEPLLGPLSLDTGPSTLDSIDWVIVGGESGPGARPMHPDWARSIRDQCAAAGVPFFMKQMDKKQPIPDDLMIREFPEVIHVAR